MDIADILGSDWLEGNEKEIAFDMFSGEEEFVSSLNTKYRTVWAVKDSIVDGLCDTYPGMGVWGTAGGTCKTANGVKMFDSMFSSLFVGARNDVLGVHGEGNHYVHGEMTVDEFTHLLGPLTVEQATILMNTLLVKGPAVFEDSVEFRKTTLFQGDETHDGAADYTKGKVRIPSTNLEIDGKQVDVHTQELVISSIRGKVSSADGEVILYAATPALAGPGTSDSEDTA